MLMARGRGWHWVGGAGLWKRALTDIIYTVGLRHVFFDTGINRDSVGDCEQGASEVGKVANKETRIKVSGEEMFACVFKQRLFEALETNPLIYISQLIFLQ